MIRVFHWLDAASEKVDRLCRIAAALFFLGMFSAVTFQVVARYIFDSPPFWTEELARWLMVWGALLGSTVAFRGIEDPAIVTPPVTSPVRQRIMAAVRFVATWMFFCPLLWFCWPFLLRQIPRVSEGLQISTGWMVSALPVACLITCLHALAGLGAVFSGPLLARQIAAQTHDDDTPDAVHTPEF